MLCSMFNHTHIATSIIVHMKVTKYIDFRGGSRIFRRGSLLVVEQVCGGLGAVPPDARKVLIE